MTRQTKIAVVLYSMAAVSALVVVYIALKSGDQWGAVGSAVIAALAVVLAFMTVKRQRDR